MIILEKIRSFLSRNQCELYELDPKVQKFHNKLRGFSLLHKRRKP